MLIKSKIKNYIPNAFKKVARNIFQSNLSSFDKLGPGSRPKMLSIEPTARCNLNCPFCLVGQQNSLESTEHDLLPRGMGDMEWNLFEKFVKDAVDFGIEKLQLHFQGEPLLYKKFPEMVKVAKIAGLKTQAFTNGLPLTEDKADKIIKAGLDHLRFSVDGATQKTYELNRVGGEFDKVYRNMEMMVKRKKKWNSDIDLMWQFIALRNNEHEIETVRKMAQAIDIPIFVKTFAESVPELVPKNPELRRKLNIKPCTDIYRNTFVFYTGEVVVCCYDLKGEYVVGDLRRQTLEEVWTSEKYQYIRYRINNAERNPDAEPEICKNCLKWTLKNFSPEDLQKPGEERIGIDLSSKNEDFV